MDPKEGLADPSAEPCFLCLRKGDQEMRQKQVDDLLHGFYSLIRKKEETNQPLTDKERSAVEKSLATFFRLAHEAPFENVREGFQKVIHEIEKKLGLHIPPATADSLTPSFFFSKIVPPINTTDPLLTQVFTNLYLQTGRVSHLDRVLAIHPSYLSKFHLTYTALMIEAGPLPVDWRNYIAILAASRHNCGYLVQLQEEEFRHNNGDLSWLSGLDHIPKKLYNLLPIVEVMSHQPWTIKPEQIGALSKGIDSWSKGELIHAMLVISTFTSLSSIVWGAGVVPEVDLQGFSSLPVHVHEVKEGANNEEENMTKKVLHTLKENKGKQLESESNLDNRHHFEKACPDDEVPAVNPVTTTSTTTTTTTTSTTATPSTSGDPWENITLKKYIGNFRMRHQDYDVRKEYPNYRYADYSWNEEGFSLLSKFFENIALPLDDEIQHIYDLTYNKLGEDEGVDTSPFRSAIWHYVHRIQGILHDDYDYANVNIYLPIQTKKVIKKLVCFPEVLTAEDMNNFGMVLKPDEKIHVVLISSEAKKQASLLYGLRAITQHSIG